jgi:organic hydroperoxide reductase OsmC/OhrA
MEPKKHHYRIDIEWTGNLGTGTSDYRSYSRDHVICAEAKPSIEASSDPVFRGNPSRWNPEELLVAAVAACHKLSYLHLCADQGISVLTYIDHAKGEMVEDPAKGGYFTKVLLQPEITIREGDDREKALQLHHEAHAKCFIANSVNFPIECEPAITNVGSSQSGIAAKIGR